MATVCGVCNVQSPRYKCPTCKLPYCSVICFKSHKETHVQAQIESEPQDLSNTKSSPLGPILPTQSYDKRGTETKKKKSDPVEDLLKSPKLSSLLAKNPYLKDTLREIYQMTLSPTDPRRASRPDPTDGVRLTKTFLDSLGKRYNPSQPRNDNWIDPKKDEKVEEMIMITREQEADNGNEVGPFQNFVDLVHEFLKEDEINVENYDWNAAVGESQRF